MNKSSSIRRGGFGSTIHVRDHRREYVNKPLDPRDYVVTGVRGDIKVRALLRRVGIAAESVRFSPFLSVRKEKPGLPWKNLTCRIAASPLIAAAASPRISFYDSFRTRKKTTLGDATPTKRRAPDARPRTKIRGSTRAALALALASFESPVSAGLRRDTRQHTRKFDSFIERERERAGRGRERERADSFCDTRRKPSFLVGE